MGWETSVYAPLNFRIYENKFLHMRKNISVYTEISLRIYAVGCPHIWRDISSAFG